MIDKVNFKKIFIFVFFCSYCLFLHAGVARAIALEVDYPQTILGTTITGGSDLTVYVKYVFEAGISLGLIIVVMTFAAAGVLYFLSPLPGSIAKAKEMLSGATSGLLILTLAYLIITTINPSLSLLSTTTIEIPAITTSEQQDYGLQLFRQTGCSGSPKTFPYGAKDIGDLKNLVKSAKINQNTNDDIYYIGILYDNINNWGKCQYIDPNKGCQQVNISTASATVYEYDFSPSGSGITIYRNAFGKVPGKGANKDNGYLKISQGDIGGLYWQELKNLSFTGDSIRQPDITTSPNDSSSCSVPYPERDCVKWSDSGLCVARRCPMLDKEAISSIELNGDYLVVLIYIDPTDNTDAYTYSYCQAFPIEDDINEYGPQQVKWDAIRSSGREPNYLLIIPVVY
ncbi:MAG TPA: hypothetical protein PLF16_00335 [Candidatus Staskawiczbacteria bacterium]|nr:hypothetical protein [Candidatus Staskawiczbacteria bacterium]